MIKLKSLSELKQADTREKWDACDICGEETTGGILHFDSGSVAPAIGETITGATSGDTGVIVQVNLTSGSYAGGDAAGVLILSSPNGYDSDSLAMFQDNETINGSTSGTNFMTADGYGGATKTGRIYPESELIECNGKKYCREHFVFKHKREWEDEVRVNVSESERGK